MIDQDDPENDDLSPEEPTIETSSGSPDEKEISRLSGLYREWFLDYASYVILDRAVPALEDGFKPVQRRLLHALHEMDDGRFNKVANVVGQTMQYHPHGDAAIESALVNMGQKGLLFDTQGNWGDPVTGDSAAAARYIEVRLSAFAKEVCFNPKTTSWQQSYDGRKKEPLVLPVKFPILLFHGVEGIAVGLATKIMPHNFVELIRSTIACLRGEPFSLLPDFPTGGYVDVSKYNDGARGGKLRVRAKIEVLSNKILVIREIPYSTTTTSLIESIITAHDKKKIKIQKVEDNTAENVEILVHILPGIPPEKAIDALYAFTDCEVGISPNCCVIGEEKPFFTSVEDLLVRSTEHTVLLLRRELLIKRHELEGSWHELTLESIFIAKKIYRAIEHCETFEAVLSTIAERLVPFARKLKRPIADEDIRRLTEIRIKRISKYDSLKAFEQLRKIEQEIVQVDDHLANIVDYAIAFFSSLLDRYGKKWPRRTEIRAFDSVDAVEVAMVHQKLYLDATNGFVGTALKKETFVCECSDIDEIIVIRQDGTFIVTAVSDKKYIGKGVIHLAVFQKKDDRTVYHLVYQDGEKGPYMVKRFSIGGITRDKEYDLTRANPSSKVVFFSANPNGEAEVIRVQLKKEARMRKTEFDFDFSSLPIRGRNTAGNILTKLPLKRIRSIGKGSSTLSPRTVWFDPYVQEFNIERRGKPIGNEESIEAIIAVYKNGGLIVHQFDVGLRLAEETICVAPYHPEAIITILYFDSGKDSYFIKRFTIPERITRGKRLQLFENPSDSLLFASAEENQVITIHFDQNMLIPPADRVIDLGAYPVLKNHCAKGKRLAMPRIARIEPVLPVKEQDNEDLREEDPREDPSISSTDETHQQ